MAGAASFSGEVDLVAELSAVDFVLQPTKVAGVVWKAPPTLRVSVARSVWAIGYANKQWQDRSNELGLLPPQFEWESIAAFRPDDPILLIHDANSVEAMMQVQEGRVVQCPLGSRPTLVYVAFLEVSPENKGSATRRFKGLGQLMLRFAAQRSKQLGHGGRLGLHALAAAESFYRQLGFAEPSCPNEYHELYFELDPSAAVTLMQEG